ncbi:MAG: hypothetical protein ACJ72H_10520 [Candidatus Sulfotelmatobacter sp.]
MARILSMAALSVVLAIVAIPILGVAQTPTNQPAPPLYRPGVGDLMTMTVQPRHLKLGLAGREKNWAYASYEHHQLEEALDRVARSWPQWRQFPIADMMTSVAKEPMAALLQAIKTADSGAYTTAYKQLTDACNSCHQATNVGVNVIVVPNASTFPNQDFRAAKP